MYLLFFSAEYFRSHLLAFSSNLDEHNPDVAEWRVDVSRVIKNALIQVQIPLSLSLSLFMGTHCFYSVNVWQDKWWSAGAAWPRWGWQTMILTMMVMNEKSKGRKRVKMHFRSCWLLQLMNTHCSEEEMSRYGSRLISKLGIDALQPLSRKRFRLKHTISCADLIYNHIVPHMQIIYFLKERLRPHLVLLFRSRQNPNDKNKPGSSVFSEHVCFGICSWRHSFIAAIAFGVELRK